MKTHIMPQGVFKDDIKGRITRPSIAITDSRFHWTPACKVDLAARFAMVRESINIQRAAEAAKGKE